jgi:hypothetical protein
MKQCQKPVRKRGQVSMLTLPNGQASDTLEQDKF